MPVYAAIDVGSNSVKLRVAHRDAAGDWRVLTDAVVVTGLGRGLALEGRLRDGDMDATLAVLACFRDQADSAGTASLVAAGTMCLRRAPNAASFVARARAEVGVPLEVISGSDEARLTFIGARSALPALPVRIVTFDIGGGSTECVLGRDGQIERVLSVDIGTLHPTESLLTADPVTATQFATTGGWIAEGLTRAAALVGRGEAIGIGGTAAVLGAVALGRWRGAADLVHGRRVTCAEIDRQIVLYRALPIAARRGLPGLPEDRADVILAGAMIARRILDLAGADHFTVSVHGLRQGLLEERFGCGGGLQTGSGSGGDPP